MILASASWEPDLCRVPCKQYQMVLASLHQPGARLPGQVARRVLGDAQHSRQERLNPKLLFSREHTLK